MKRPLVLLALVWVPFLLIFGFAAPAVVDAVGDSHPHIAFHLLAGSALAAAFVVVRRLLREPASGVQRVLLRVLLVALPLAVLGNVLELVAAVRRLAEDGWVSRRTEDLFGPEGGLHTLAATLTIPAHMAGMVLTLAVVVTRAVQRRRRLEPVQPG